jgi:hypothetical protein
MAKKYHFIEIVLNTYAKTFTPAIHILDLYVMERNATLSNAKDRISGKGLTKIACERGFEPRTIC